MRAKSSRKDRPKRCSPIRSHPYTWALLNAAPRLDRDTPGDKRLITIEGTPPDPLNWPTGCRFAARCPFRVEKCDEHPELLAVGGNGHTPVAG